MIRGGPSSSYRWTPSRKRLADAERYVQLPSMDAIEQRLADARRGDAEALADAKRDAEAKRRDADALRASNAELQGVADRLREELSEMGELRRELAAARAPRDDAPPPPPPLRNPQVAELQREVERLTDEAESRRATSFVEATRLRDEADAARAVASDLRDDLRAAEGQRDEAVDVALEPRDRPLELPRGSRATSTRRRAGVTRRTRARCMRPPPRSTRPGRRSAPPRARATAPSPTRRGCRRRSTRRGPSGTPRGGTARPRAPTSPASKRSSPPRARPRPRSASSRNGTRAPSRTSPSTRSTSRRTSA